MSQDVKDAYSSPPWWYDVRGFFILTFAYRGTLGEQIRFFGSNVGPRHLEVAIGTGTLFEFIWRWRQWKKLSPSSVCGLDYAPAMLAGARRRFRSVPDIELLEGDVGRMPHPDNTFDTVNIANAVHCFPDVEAALKEVLRVMKPGGRLALNGLLHPQDPGILGRLAERINQWGQRKGILHSAFFRESLQRTLRQSGFEVLREWRSGYGFYAQARKPVPVSQVHRPDPAAMDRLKPFGLAERDPFWSAAFGRTIGAISQGELQRLSVSRVAIPGMGGAGGGHLTTLVRAGVGRFHIADMDNFGPVNFNRQQGARVDTIGQPKVDVMKRDALAINPFLEISCFPKGISPGNVDDFLRGVDVVLDGLDFFAWRARRMLFNRARELGIPVVSSGPIGFGSSTLVFRPDGMGFDDYFDIHDDTPEDEAILRFYMGLMPSQAPRSYADVRRIRLESKMGPSLSMGCMLISAAAGTEVLRLLLGRPGGRTVPGTHQLDLYLGKQFKRWLPWGNRGWGQRTKLMFARRLLRRKALATRPWFGVPEWDRVGPAPSDVMNHIGAMGTQAPSRDNTQPWKIERMGDRMRLHPAPERDDSYFNVRGITTALACGSAAENMSIAASAFGLEAEIKVSVDPAGPLADLSFKQTQRSWDALGEALLDRETNRRPYEAESVSPEALERLNAEVSCFNGVRCSWVTERRDLRRIADAAYWSTLASTHVRAIHGDLQKNLWNNLRSAREKGEGFSLPNYYPGGILGAAALRLSRRWEAMRVMNGLGFGHAIAAHKRRIVFRSGAVGLLSVESADPNTLFGAGRALQRLWLAATLSDLAVHPVSNLPLLLLRRRMGMESPMPEIARRGLDLAADLAEKAFPDISHRAPVLLIRLGRARPVNAGTFRRPFQG